MKIAVRMDDISPGMDMEKFYIFYGMLKRHGTMPLLGIVPDNQDPNLNINHPLEQKTFFELVRKWEAEGCVLALHGCSHVYQTAKGGLFPLNSFSEFAGLPLDEQREKIAVGKQILEENGISTDIFMAPAHSYDKNTLCALKEYGFNYITDGFGNEPYERKKVIFFPISFSQKKTLAGGKGYSTLVFHVNTMNDADFERYDKIFEEKREMFIPYSEYLQAEVQERRIAACVKEWMMAKTKHFLVKLREKL